MIPTVCQRWRNGRARYRPAGEVFDTARASVQAIDESTAKAFTVAHHYAASYPAARFRAGLFVQGRTSRESLVGVAVFSVPMSQGVIPRWFAGLRPAEGVELGRLVLLDDVASNAESWFVARAFKLLREKFAAVNGVLSYCDPVERVNAAGELVKRGHVGTVYQALNAAYLGRAAPRTMILSRDGRVFSQRALSKLRNGEVGEAYAYQQLRSLGAPERRPFEGGKEFAKRALREGGFRAVRHPGNHTYAWWLGERRARPAWEPMAYPKAAA
jgi:hypothetical protein